MNIIDGIQSTMGASAVQPANPVAAAARATGAAAPADVVEISTVARLAAKVHELPDVRAELVSRVKAEIAAGNYETPERIDIAVNRLMDELIG